MHVITRINLDLPKVVSDFKNRLVIICAYINRLCLKHTHIFAQARCMIWYHIAMCEWKMN